ncbi:hypothetical protein [Radicibacter daui]|uniref:hypothetical protein n=1 Tax=Radicibacter daui TaxID=3064829 RepID=UPI004046A1CB
MPDEGVAARSQGTRSVSENPRDSLHKLPLADIPLETPGLRKACMIKNVQLESVVELFNDERSGSGQVAVRQLGSIFPADKATITRDSILLSRLASLNSFDVYSLRLELRRLDIQVNDVAALKLSEEKRRELTTYMKSFTLPLIQQVFGNGTDQFNDVFEIINAIAKPNRDEAINNLRRLADGLNITIQDIPEFLEDYGDVFLSLAYFRSCLDRIVPEIHEFLGWMMEIKNSWQHGKDRPLMRTLDQIQGSLNDITASITGRFEYFDRRSQRFWEQIDAATFRQVKEAITSHHVTIGGVLCGLAVKMSLWKQRFGSNPGSPNRRVEFLKSEMIPGLDTLRTIEMQASATKD